MTCLLRHDSGRRWMVLLVCVLHLASGFLSERRWLENLHETPTSSGSSWPGRLQRQRHIFQSAAREEKAAARAVSLSTRDRTGFVLENMLTMLPLDRHDLTMKKKDARFGTSGTRHDDPSSKEVQNVKILKDILEQLKARKTTDSRLFPGTRHTYHQGLGPVSADGFYYSLPSKHSDLSLPLYSTGLFDKRELGHDSRDSNTFHTAERWTSGDGHLTARGDLEQREERMFGTADVEGGRRQLPGIGSQDDDIVTRKGVSVHDTARTEQAGRAVMSKAARKRNRKNGQTSSAVRSSRLSHRIQSLGSESDVEYEDYLTPPPPVVNVTLSPHSSEAFSAPKHIAPPEGPQRGPHRLSFPFTPAPRHINPSAGTDPTRTHFFLSVFPHESSDAPNQTWYANPVTGIQAQEASSPSVSAKDRTILRDEASTVGAGPQGAGFRSTDSGGGGGGGGAAHSPNVACLQFVRVEHDVPCAGGRHRRDVLSTQHLTSLLQHHGGSASSPFTAPTLHAASSGFRNLMPLGIPEMDELLHLRYTTEQLHTLLENHHHFAHRHPQPATSLEAPRSTNVRTTSRRSLHRNSTRGSNLEEGEEAEDLAQELSHDVALRVAILQRMVPARLWSPASASPRRRKRSFDARNGESYACNYSVDCQHFDSSGCHDNQTEMILDDNNCHTCRCKVREAVNGYCQTSSSSASTRATSSSSSSTVHAARVHLCTQCQQVRHLGDGIFPSYLQEVVCHPSHGSCLNISGFAQGQCQESAVPMVFLRRVPSRCMRVHLTSGQSLLADDWQLFQRMVHTGCQCMVDKRSPLVASIVGS